MTTNRMSRGCGAIPLSTLLGLWLSGPAYAYNGPGAGIGGGSSVGWAALIALVILAGLGLCALGGLVALVIAIKQRLRCRVQIRRAESEECDA